MKAIEFVYWLQGFMEVAKPTTINEQQIEKIKNHLNMVKITEDKNPTPFCSWLTGYLDFNDSNSLNEEQTNKIKNKLNDIFEHVVQTPKEKENPVKPVKGKHSELPVAMC